MGPREPCGTISLARSIEKPDASNTGHNAGLLDGTLTGSQWMDTPGVTVENKTINGKVVICADNVTFRNCVFTGGTTAQLVESRNVSGTLIEDCTFLPADVDTPAYIYNAFRGCGATIRRCDLSGVCDGFSLYRDDDFSLVPGVVIEQNWVHDLWFGADAGQGDGKTHNDGVQVLTACGCEVRYNNFEITAGAWAHQTHTDGTPGFIVTDGAAGTITQPNINIHHNSGFLVNVAP